MEFVVHAGREVGVRRLDCRLRSDGEVGIMAVQGGQRRLLLEQLSGGALLLASWRIRKVGFQGLRQ